MFGAGLRDDATALTITYQPEIWWGDEQYHEADVCIYI